SSRMCTHRRDRTRTGGSTGSVATQVYSSATDVLQVFAGLETDGASGRDAHFLAGAGIATDTALARLHLKHAEAPQFDAFAASHGVTHRIEDGLHGHLGLHLGDGCHSGDVVDDIDLDHLVPLTSIIRST